MLSKRNFPSLILLCLVVLYWLTRLININSLAVFLDEAIHLSLARDVWHLHPFTATGDGRLLNVWWIALFYPFNSGVLIARISVVLLTTIGLVCAIAVTRHYFSFYAAVVAGLLYIFMPLTFFFERMALADSLSAPFVMISIWMIVVNFVTAQSNRKQLLWGTLSGVMLAGAALSKISNLIFLCVPVLSIIFLIPFKEWRSKGLLLGVSAYLGFAIALSPILIYLNISHQTGFGVGLVTLKTGGTIFDLPAQIEASWKVVMYFVTIYLPFPMGLIAVICVALALWKGKQTAWFIGAILIVTISALIVMAKPAYLASRFLPVYAPLIAILVGGGLAAITIKWRQIFMLVACLALISSGVTFAWQAWTDPTNILLGEDYWQYIAGWPSGYGMRDVALDFIKRDEKAQLVTLDLGNSQKLDSYLLGRTNKVTTYWYKDNSPLEGKWLVIDMPIQENELKQLNLQVTEVTRYYRPSKESWVIIYQVAP